jgi:hypothetical protein
MSELHEAAARLRDPVPIVYSILHQGWPDVPEPTYRRSILALHGAIRAAALRFRDALLRSEEERGAAPDALRPQADPRRFPPLDAREYRFLFPGSESSLSRRFREGVAYLEGLGFEPSGGGALHESEFLLSGSPVIDFLEIVVRDLVGIDRAAHGAQIRALSSVCFILRNRVFEVGRRLPGGNRWAVLYFEKPGSPGSISYGIFRAALRTLLDDHLERGSFPYAALHQRKLGLGRGAEFSLRLQLSGGDVDGLAPFLEDLFQDGGALEALRFAFALQEELPVLEAGAADAGYNSPP